MHRLYSRVSLLSLSALALFAAAPARALPLDLHKGWKVATLQARNAPYCAMVGRFDQGVSLVIARTPDGLSSLAIDLNKSIFKTGQAYDLNLQIGSLLSRRYSVRAVSPRAFIVQTGADEALYGAINDGGTINVKVDAVDISLASGRFMPAYTSLVDCVAKIRPPIEDAPKVAAVPVAPVEENKITTSSKIVSRDNSAEWKNKLASAQAEKDTLKKQLENLLQDKSTLSGQLDATATQMSALQKQLEAASEQKARVAEMLDSQINENKKLQSNFEVLNQKFAALATEAAKPPTPSVPAEMPRLPVFSGVGGTSPAITAPAPSGEEWETVVIQ